MTNKILFLLISVLLVLMIGLTGGLYMMWNKLSSLNTQINQTINPQDKPSNVEKGLGPVFSLETFIVNLADKGGKRYLRVTIDLELNNIDIQEELNKRLPQVRDTILMILPTKRFEDINNTEGKIALREEILAKLNSLFGKESITSIFFTEFVVQ